MNKVYVVKATDGEYSDQSHWMVAAYADKLAAELHRDLANKWVKENVKDPGYAARSETLGKCPWDAVAAEGMCGYGDGPRYYVEEVSFFLHPDQYQGLT